MKSRCLLLVALSASITMHPMNLSLFGRLKSLSGHAATLIASKCSSALSLAKEHKALAFGVAATAAVVTLAYKLRQMFQPKFWIDQDFFNAVAADDLERARSLKAAGANVNFANQFGMTALHVAADCGKPDAIRFLLNEANANTEVLDLFGMTPLHYAAKEGEPTVIQLLLNARAKKEVEDNIGWTPLHFAAAFGRRGSVIALLKAGAKKDVVDMQGFTPLDLARGERDLSVVGVEKVIFPEIVELLNQ